MRLYGVTPETVLRRNIFKARHVIQQDYDVTSLKVYAITLLLWKAKTSESALRHPRGDQGLYTSKNSTRTPKEITPNLLLYSILHKQLLSWFRWISFYYRVTLGFGSIASGLDQVNLVIRLPIEHGISRIMVSLDIRWISFDYRVTLGFGSIASGLDHVNPVIRLPIEHGIRRVLG
ncbi:hypothetical protein Tco_0999512 [Tanacetum coccineum]